MGIVILIKTYNLKLLIFREVMKKLFEPIFFFVKKGGGVSSEFINYMGGGWMEGRGV